MPVMNEDHILDFLDGRLATGDEEELLHTLAVSPERRQLLREHLKLRELTSTLAKQDRFSVPKHVTTQLFQTLCVMGFTAPVSTEAILTNAPQLIKAREKDREPIPSQFEGRPATGRRTRISSLFTASLVSFMLGLGAFYVFGSNLGIKTLSMQRADALHRTTSHSLAALSVHEQSDIASATIGSATTQPLHAGVLPASPILSNVALFPGREEAALGEIAKPTLTEAAPLTPQSLLDSKNDDWSPIGYTAPKPIPDRVSNAPKFSELNVLPYWNAAIPFPFQNEKGTISVRFGSGRAPGNSTLAWSSLSELKFTWTVLDYIIGRASLGQLISYERQPQFQPAKGSVGAEITAESMRVPISVIGAELGVTLDPIDIPIEASAGVMFDGGGHRYMRGGVFAHFEPWRSLSVSVGMEGLIYQRNISTGIEDLKSMFSGYKPLEAPGTLHNETDGFIGPSIEIGWHF